MDEREMAETLAGMLDLAGCGDLGDSFEELADCEVRSFDDAGLMTANKGVVVTTAEGATFQITVVRTA